MKWMGTILTAILLLGCSSDDLPDIFALDRFRVLALSSTTSEANPGDAVTVTAVVSDVTGEGRTILMSAVGCIDPGVNFGVTPTCDGSDTQVILASNATIGGLTAPTYSGAVTPNLAFSIPAEEVIFALADDDDRFNGVGFLVLVTFTLPDDTTVEAFRLINVTEREPNVNPAYEATPILSDGSAISARPDEEIPIQVDLTDTSQETYELIRTDGQVIDQDEELTTAWYVSAGELSTSVVDGEEELKWNPPDAWPTDYAVVLIAVTRDDRGGVVSVIESY